MRSNLLFPNSRQFDAPPRNGRVAIITRTKNRPLLLARAFASMLEQQYANWHLYLVNDGGDPAAVDALVAQYRTFFADRLTLIHHPESLGMEAASNAGLAAVRDCDYVVIHDDDDAWHPQFLLQTVRHLEDPAHNRHVAVAARCEVVHEEIQGQDVIEVRREPWVSWKPTVDLLDQLQGNCFPPICLLIRHAAIDLTGPFNADLPVLGDWDYNLRLLLVGDIGTINADLAYYHHRIDHQTGSIYGNSVHSGIDKHKTYLTLYRNSLLRMLLRKEPGFIGLSHLLLSRIAALENHVDHLEHEMLRGSIKEKLDWIHWDINQSLPWSNSSPEANTALNRNLIFVINCMAKMLRPFNWVWHHLLPLRRMIARLRGRI